MPLNNIISNYLHQNCLNNISAKLSHCLETNSTEANDPLHSQAEKDA